MGQAVSNIVRFDLYLEMKLAVSSMAFMIYRYVSVLVLCHHFCRLFLQAQIGSNIELLFARE